MTDIDPYPVKELVHRYSKSRDVVYKRLNALNITPHRTDGNQSYITLEELHRMDALNKHVEDGGRLADFEDAILLNDTTDTSLFIGQSDTVSQPLSDLNVQQFLELAQVVASIIRPPEKPLPPDPFYHYEQLERFSQFGWQIHSRDLRLLIGTPKGNPIRYGSFLISRVGSRWWKVERKD